MRWALVPAVALAAVGCSAAPSSSSTGSGGSSGASSSKAHVDAGPARGDAGHADAGPVDGGSDGGPLQYCPDGSVQFPGLVIDLCQTFSLGASVPLAGVQVTTLEHYSATVADENGQYFACLPSSGAPTTLVFTLPGYMTGYLAELSLTASLWTQQAEIVMPMACTAAAKSYFEAIPDFDPTLANVLVVIFPAGDGPPCDPLDAGLAGWSFEASLLDGGVGDGGPWPTGYFDQSGTLQATGATYASGEALVFDIDPAAQYVEVQGSWDAGSECPPVNTGVGFTGHVHVAPSTLSFLPWILP